MPEITRELLRKRAEHNEGVLTTLEEISLHQEELESINEVLGLSCRKIKILYLQNNLIPKMENLFHLKDLGYLNLALNNIKKIEGLQNCEFLYKLDLTVNFIDVDSLEESITHLASRACLRDLYMMGNPCQGSWEKFSLYVIARLPQLRTLDGVEVTKSMQIVASQQLPQLEAELRSLAAIKLREAGEKKGVQVSNKAEDIEEVYSSTVIAEDVDFPESNGGNDEENGKEMTDNTPEARVKIYKELAEQKKDKADREKANQPRKRDYDAEHAEAVVAAREKEEHTEEAEMKQRNEGGWDFLWDEETKKGALVLEVMLPKHMDTSLIDVDVHPTYVSVVIKGKLLRLRLPAEVKSGEAACLRSKTTGSLMVTMPKLNPREVVGLVRPKEPLTKTKSGSAGSAKPSTQVMTKKLSLLEEAMLCAKESTPSTLVERKFEKLELLD